MSTTNPGALPSTEPALTDSSRPAIDRTDSVSAANDRRKAEAEVPGLCGQGSVDDFLPPPSVRP